MELVSKEKVYSEDQWLWLSQLGITLNRDELYTLYSSIDMCIYKEDSMRAKCGISKEDTEASVNKKIKTLTQFRDFLNSELNK